MHTKGILTLRHACEDDAKMLWEWANNPEVRVVSFSSKPIPWGEHVQWLKSRLNDPNCIFYIAINSDGIPIGQVRYDIEGNEAVISISIDKKFRGEGYGSILIQLGSQKLFEISNIKEIHGYKTS